MNRIKSTLIAIFFLGTAVTLNSSVVFAANPCDELKTDSSDGTSIIKCGTNGGNPIIGIMLEIINFLAFGVGIAVVGGIIWGGMVYASSNGDSSKVQQAKTIIVNAVIGLLLFIFMYAIINFLVPGGLFTPPPPTP